MGEDGGLSIGEVSHRLAIPVDTLRYYEKIGLLPAIHRSPSGRRVYSSRDLSRLRFIRRAQAMSFSLAEIAQLLQMRQDPQHAKDEVRSLTRRKLAETEARLAEIQTLRNELQLLVNLCGGSEKGCPIIQSIDEAEELIPGLPDKSSS